MQKLAGSIQARKAMDCSCKKKYTKDISLLNMLEVPVQIAYYTFGRLVSRICIITSVCSPGPQNTSFSYIFKC
jgi:hypothetical protein